MQATAGCVVTRGGLAGCGGCFRFPTVKHALDHTLGCLRPALLLLDPLVRLHRLDENSAADIAALLGSLRELNRRHQVALILVHHLAKRSQRNLG